MSWFAQTLAQILAGHAACRPEAEALVTAKTRLTYAQLDTEVRHTAAGLRDLGISKGDHVALFMGNDEKWLILFYAAASIGAVTVPVNTRFKASELAFCLKQADCKMLFYAKRFLNIDYEAMVGEVRPGLPKLEHAIAVDSGLPLGEPDGRSDPSLTPDDPLLIQFTSGTTAYPKGVVLTHDNMLRNAWAAGDEVLAGIRVGDGHEGVEYLLLRGHA